MLNNRQIEEGECSRNMQNMQDFQEELQFQQQYLIQQFQNNGGGGGGGGREYDFSQVSPMLQPWSDPFLIPPPPLSYPAGFFNRTAPSFQFSYDGSSMEQLRILSNSFGVQAEIDKMTAQEIMDAKALAASKSHSEAERRRRERINNHLAKLRTLLPSNTKTDKASLLAEVIQHVKELKRQTSLIAETNLVPTENDELTVDASDDDGKFVIRASICCDDRSDFLPDLIKTLKSLRLRTLKAEITTMGGRTKNVLFITGDDDSSGEGEEQEQLYCISSIQEALKAVMEKTRGDDSNNASTVVKRQRTSNVNTL